MFKKAEIFFLIAETPLHPGSGSELGVVDLPIQRERHTGFPKIEASGLKGCIRETWNRKECLTLLFGPEPESEKGSEHAGALIFTDARILLFPVKSIRGVFGWITCPSILERFKKDLEIAGISHDFHKLKVDELKVKEDKAVVPEGTELLLNRNKLVLEEYAFNGEENDGVKALAESLADKIFSSESTEYWKEKLKKNLVILSDDVFRDFVETSTEIIARTRIDVKTGTVKKGALWYEEYLPQDTVLYFLVMASPLMIKEEHKEECLKDNTPENEAEKVLNKFKEKIPSVLQIGGNQTIGKGIVRIQTYNKKEDKNDRQRK